MIFFLDPFAVRTKEFDEEQALARAVQMFWTRGYEGTSMHDLERAMGIKRQSLYNTFESKQALFERALAHYHQSVIIPNLAALRTSKAPMKAIENYFRARIDDVFDPSAIKGCLITNSVTERAIFDERVRALTAQSIEYMQGAFTAAVANARKSGEIGQDKDPVLWGALLVNCAQGLFVLSKIRPDRKTLTASVKKLLDLLKS